MRPLELNDERRVEAALGWLELGDAAEAQVELDEIELKSKLHPSVLKMRWNILAFEGNWQAALEIAQNVLMQSPQDFSGWMMEAESLCGLGRPQDALEALLPAKGLFPHEPILPYLLACYSAGIGSYADAHRWLTQAVELDDSPELKIRALDDPDLAAFWQSIPASSHRSRNRGFPARKTRNEKPR
jgi:predicted Zn-dependent protease